MPLRSNVIWDRLGLKSTEVKNKSSEAVAELKFRESSGVPQPIARGVLMLETSPE